VSLVAKSSTIRPDILNLGYHDYYFHFVYLIKLLGVCTWKPLMILKLFTTKSVSSSH